MITILSSQSTTILDLIDWIDDRFHIFDSQWLLDIASKGAR